MKTIMELLQRSGKARGGFKKRHQGHSEYPGIEEIIAVGFGRKPEKGDGRQGSSPGWPHHIRSPLAGCVDGEKICRAVQRYKWTDNMASVVIIETVIDLAFTGKIVVIGGRVIDSALCQLISTDHHLYSVNQGKTRQSGPCLTASLTCKCDRLISMN